MVYNYGNLNVLVYFVFFSFSESNLFGNGIQFDLSMELKKKKTKVIIPIFMGLLVYNYGHTTVTSKHLTFNV